MTREYRTAAAFKQALEQRLRAASTSGIDFARRRQLVVFDRFLARIALELGDAVTLKCGLAVELRIERARTTKDVDLRKMGPPDDILVRLRAAAKRDLGDFMVFTIRPDARHLDIQNDGMQYDGVRFRAECTLAGKVYGRPFGVDVAFGDPILGEPGVLVADDALAFAGIAPPTLRVYPVETHIAEKLHAYTMPRARPNSRVKDLPDLALIATAGSVEAGRPRRDRPDLRLPRDARRTWQPPSTARHVGGPLRDHREGRPAAVAHPRRGLRSSPGVSRSRACRPLRRPMGPGWLVVDRRGRMTSITPTVADEIERYLRTGDTDPYHAAWSSPSFLERAQLAAADLENALVTEVSRRANGWHPPPALVAIEDLAAFTRAKVEPMVRGLFPRAEQDAVMALVEKSVVFLTPSNIEEVLREAQWPRSAWDRDRAKCGRAPQWLEGDPRALRATEATTPGCPLNGEDGA